MHVEHIYSQRPPDGERWDGHDEWVHRIGNLTLLHKMLNAAIRNGSFAKKRPSYEKSELLLTKDLLQYTAWTPDEIEDRQQRLADLAPEAWPML